jgi:hypothetical protein
MIGLSSATLLSAGAAQADEIVVLEPETVDSAVGSIIDAVKVFPDIPTAARPG